MAKRLRLNTLWIGPALGRIERACLRSALTQGHAITLYCYRPVEGVPDGVEVADAAAIVPEDRVVRHRNGSPSLFSNLFRYTLQQRGLGTWIDCDLYFVAPLDHPKRDLFGWQDSRTVNNAVLRLPPDSPILKPLISIFDEREVPPWLNSIERAAATRRLHESGRTGISDMPWGSAGPNALTALLRQTGLLRNALPEAAFYPAPPIRAGWIRSPLIPLDRMTRQGTIAVHLWNELIKGFKDDPAPPGSFLSRLHEEGA